MKHIYLDYNASAPLLPEAFEAMSAVLRVDAAAYNASSQHCFGRKAQQILDSARAEVAKLVNAEPDQVIFNSGATEGNNTILLHFANTYPDDQILVSATEHPSVLQSAKTLNNVKLIPVDENGAVRMDALEELLSGNKKTSLVSCMAANNETGAIQCVSDISAMTHKYGALFHSDATQGAGRIKISMKDHGIDFLTLSSHKIGGAQGVGALVIGICGQTPALLFGGGQEKYLRAGTQNIAGIASFGAAAKTALQNIDDYERIKQLRDKFESKLKEISAELIIHSAKTARLPNTSLFSDPSINSQSMIMALDLEGFAISGGSACSSGSTNPSSTLKAMGLNEEISSSALRVSIGWATKESDIEEFLAAWKKIHSRMSNKR